MILYFVLVFVVGYVVGSIITDYHADRLYISQQKRGDYWYDKYMMAVRDDWEPLCEGGLSEAD